MHILISVCCINERRIRILSTRWKELKLSSVDNMWSFKVSLHSIHITAIQPPKTHCKTTYSTVYTISSQTSSCLHNIHPDLIMFTQYPPTPASQEGSWFTRTSLPGLLLQLKETATPTPHIRVQVENRYLCHDTLLWLSHLPTGVLWWSTYWLSLLSNSINLCRCCCRRLCQRSARWLDVRKKKLLKMYCASFGEGERNFLAPPRP